MATAIRLYRIGKKDQPYYRIVVVNKRYKANGKYIEEIGKYHPLKEPALIELNQERFDYWVNCGAIISEGLAKVLKYKKSLEKKKSP
ncbi:MAG: 30S ribosomal protein S16 [Patescibacteria group bacterium]|nr:30S ribosomal protein S16 [Patescibacteria group bacterium]MCX7956074.1 30S ribosomal protein S16 [Patescibacteria group bacterium]